MRYLIIGNGVAGITAAMALRRRDAAASISILSGESDFFFSRTALMYSYMDRMTRKDLEPYERKLWKDLRLELIRGWAQDLDPRRQQVLLEDKRTLPYDKLLLATGSCARQPDWEGLNPLPEGVANFVTLADLDRCERFTSSTREAVVVGGGLIGVELVECLLHHKKKVSFLVKDPWYWPVALSNEKGKEEAELIHEHIRGHGVNLQLQQNVSAVLSDSSKRVRAIRTQSGQEFPCQFLGITIGVEPQISWLRSAAHSPLLNRGVLVDPAFQTSIPNVFAAGDCAEISHLDSDAKLAPKGKVEQIWYSAKRQGELAALSMLGDKVDYRAPIFFNSAKFFDMEYTTIGQVNDAPPTADHFFWRHPTRPSSLRLVTHDGAFIGANFLGSRWDHTLFEKWILERRSLQFCLKHLPDAQFDVEFGRLDLSPFYAQYPTYRSQQ